MEKKKLFIIDAFAIIFRAHFAFSKTPRVNSKGESTGAILGFLNSMLEIINKEKPTHLAVAFDTPEATFRTEVFPEYKAHREAAPEEISFAVPHIKSILKGFGIPIFENPGYEADDVVGAMAKVAKDKGYEVYMMTLDKDYAQLVDENVYLYKVSNFGRGTEVFDVPKVLEKWEVNRVDQVADILGLWGDASDNIPGIPGIGEKTAKKLIAKYDTVENLVAHAHELKGKQKENVENFGEQGILSKKLATIFTDIPIDFDEDKLLYTGPQKEVIQPIFDALEFRNLNKRVFGEENTPTASPKEASTSGQMSMFDAATTTSTEKEILPEEKPERKNIHNTIHQYHFIDTVEKRASLIKFLAIQKEFCFDTETTSVNAYDAQLVGIAFSYFKGEAYYVPIPSKEKEAMSIIQEFRDVLGNEDILKVGQNIKYDIMVLKNYGVDVKGPIFDTMLAHYLIQPEARHNMDILAENYLNYTPVSITTLIGKKGKNQLSMADVDPEKVTEYAGEDADITLQLKKVLSPELDKFAQHKLLTEVEVPLINVLSTVERNGVRLDIDFLENMSKELAEASSTTERKIYEQAGTEFNIASPKQLGDVLFEKLKLDPKAKKTKTGQYATGEEILTKLADKHEIIDNILKFREYNKLKSTYVDALPKMVSSKDGKIHTSYRQAVAATGRLSSDNPNLQNIPIRTEMGRQIRKAFIPHDDDFVLFSADYSQIELRIMADFAEDKHMIAAFKEGRDIHATTASKVYNVPLEEVTPEQRRAAKSVNFGIIYGISAFGLSQNLSIPRKEAQEIIDAYFREFDSIKTCMDDMINKARENEYAETILGRRRYLRDINSRNHTQRSFAERNAVNAPIQGSAADMIKVAMINIHEWMQKEKLKSKMILQVHDELVFDTHRDELDLIREKVPEFMRNAVKMKVPIEVGIGEGENWLEAH